LEGDPFRIKHCGPYYGGWSEPVDNFFRLKSDPQHIRRDVGEDMVQPSLHHVGHANPRNGEQCSKVWMALG
jgi:hypothetical protein